MKNGKYSVAGFTNISTTWRPELMELVEFVPPFTADTRI
jgi:hypothetical protein